MRVAAVQSNVTFNDPIANAERAIAKLKGLKGDGVELAVFPEAYLTGYCVTSTEAAASIAIPASHESLRQLKQASEELDMLVVVGFAEVDGENLYNSAALFEPGKDVRYYRKTHLPDLGLDKFVCPGDAIDVFETRLGKIGVLICFDLRPPEATRSLALQGAELVVLPTNWPVGAEVSADHIAIARAGENRVFVVTCNRVGEENGFRFIGRSKIVNPGGQVLAAGADEETVLVADLDLSVARQKRTVTIPGLYETDVFTSRRPELYEPLVRNIA